MCPARGAAVHPSVMVRMRWKQPDYELQQKNSTIKGRYGLMADFEVSCYRCEMAPFFQAQAPTFAEGDSLKLPRPLKITTMVNGLQAEWDRWCIQYRNAFHAVLDSWLREAGRAVRR